MQDKDKAKLELRAKPMQPVQVNRPVVLAIIAVIVLAILLAIIQAFNVTVHVKNSSSAIKATIDKPLALSSELKDLPGSYSDVNGIQRYSAGGSQIGEITKLQQQLNALKDAYGMLEQQFRGRKQEEPERPSKNPQDAEAAKSSMTFSGVGSGAENLIGADTDKSSRTPFGQASSNKTGDLVATQQQADLFEKEGENKQRLAVMKAVVEKDKPEDIYDLHSIIKPFSKYQVQAGTIIQATLITGIDTSLAGTIVAQVRQDVYDTVTGKHLLIPKGSKLLGEYDSRVSYGQRRILMFYTRIVRPDGTSILLGRPNGADMLGQSGVEGNVDNHWARVLGAATISTLLSVGASMWGNQGINNANMQSTGKQNAAAGAASSFSAVGQDLTSKAAGLAPTITLEPGRQFIVTVKKDMVLSPYRPRR
ncbi:type IV secretion system protein TrbI [Gammaproteobacteria bacterium]